MCFGSSKSANANGEKPARPAPPPGTHTSFAVRRKRTDPSEKPQYHTKAGTSREIPREEGDGMTRAA